MDPYQVLEISRSASTDEIKKAYRTLSRKYHPDANINNPNKNQAEERFKQIQQAYKQIMDEKENGYKNASGFSYKYSYNGQDAEYQSDENIMHLKAAANYINNCYYNEALNVLNQMHERNGQWYYLSAIANTGLGNNILALEYAKQAVMLEPQNSQFAQLVYQLEAGGEWYQNMQRPYNSSMVSEGVCTKICITYMVCNLCASSMCCNPIYFYH